MSAEVPVQRDARGRLVKGGPSLNKSGLDRKKLMMLRNLEGLTPKAIATLERLLNDANGSVALGAAKEVLDRNLGKVKQQVQVDVTSTHVLHLQALEELAARKKAQLIEAQAQLIEAQATEIKRDETLYIEGSHGDNVIEAVADNSTGAAEPPVPGDPPGAAADAPPSPPSPATPLK